MGKGYLFAAFIACLIGIAGSVVYLPLAYICLGVENFCAVMMLRSIVKNKKNEKKEQLMHLFADIFEQKDRLYEREKGKIIYKIDKKTMRVYVQAHGFSSPVLSFVYDKKTGSVSVEKQNRLLNDTTVEQFQQFLFEEKVREKDAKPVHKETPFMKRVERLQAFRKRLLEEVGHLDIETRHLLEQTIAEDLTRLLHVMEISPQLDEERMEKLLEQVEIVLLGIQDSLAQQNDQAIDQLEALFSARYRTK